MYVDELSAVSDTLISLACMCGFDLHSNQVDLPRIQFPCLENIDVWCKSETDLKFIINILENSIPSSGHRFLKKLNLFHDPSLLVSTNYGNFSTSLSNVIKVSTCFSNCSGFIRIESVGIATQSLCH
jgi:hypothetical protein